ncbi:MAG: hypothetical protein U0T81_05795 [Saprospiraceae bacterium]
MTKKAASQVTASVMNAELGKTSPIEIIVKETSGSNRTVNVEVRTVGTSPSEPIRFMHDRRKNAQPDDRQRQRALRCFPQIHHSFFR